MAAPIRVTFVGDEASLLAATAKSEAALARFAESAQEAARVAAKAAADEAAAAGKTATEQQAAAARAAAAVVEASERTTAAQDAAARGAIAIAKAQEKSADEQVAAAQRAIAAQKEVEAQQKAASDAAGEAAAKTSAAADASAERVATAGKKLASVGKWTLFGGVAGVAASVKGAADLSQAMERLHTQAGASTQQVAALQQGVLKMSGAVGEGPEQLAQGMYHVVSNLNKTLPAAQRVTDELGALKVAAEGARVGGSDLVDTTNALGAAIRSGISGTQNYQQAMGALNATVGAGDMTMQQLAEALGTGTLGPMKTYGVSLKDISSALAVFGDNNIRGADAGTKLTSAIRIMAAPSAAAAKGLAVLHLGVTQLADDIRGKGLPAAIQDLENHLRQFGGTPSEQADMVSRIFGGRQSTGVQILLNQLGALKASEKEVSDGANKFGGAWKSQQQQVSQQAAELKATVQALADKFGLVLIPDLEAVAHETESVVDWFEKHKTAAEVLAGVITGVLGTAVAVFAYQKAVAFVSGTRGMITGMGKLVSGVASGAASIEEKLLGVSSASTDTATKVEVSNAEAGASFTGVATKAGTAGTALEGEWAATGAEIESTNATIEDSNAAMGASFAAPASDASKLLSVMTKLADIGTIVITVAIVEKGFSQLLDTIKNYGGNALNFTSPTSKNLIAGSSGSKMTADQYLKMVGEKPGTAISGSSPEWQQLGISKSRWDHLSKAQRASLLPSNLNKALTPSSRALPGVPGSATTADPQQLVNFLAKSLGLTTYQAAGIAGNLQEESANTFAGNIVQGGTRSSTPTTNVGYGLAQWTTAGRQQGLEDLAKQMGLSPDSIKAQEAYIVQELKGSYSGVLSQLKGATSASQAAQIVETGYESPANPGQSLNEREAYANALAGGSVSGGGNPSQALLDYLNGVSSKSVASKRQATANRRATSSSSISTTISDDVTRYKDLASSATGSVRQLYLSVAKQIQDLGPKFEAEAKGASTAAQESQIKDALKVALTGITSGLAANVKKAALRQTASSDIQNTISKAIQTYQEDQQNATTSALKSMYGSTISDVRKTGKTFEGRASHLTTSGERTNLTDALSRALQAIHSDAQTFAKASTAGTSLTTRFGNAAQSGTVRTLENALGFRTTGRFLPDGGLGMTGAERESEPSNMAMLRQTIEGLGNAVFGRAGTRSLTSTVTGMTSGTSQDAAFHATVENLIKSGQTKEADQLVAAHKAAMQSLVSTLIANQKAKDGEELDLQATTLKDQTTATQDAMQNAQNIWQAGEQKINDMASGVLQAMQDTQQTVNDKMAGVAQAIKDQTAINTDQSQSIVDGINDAAQTNADMIAERGLYGMNLVAQQDKVAADQVKAYWDQQIDAAQKQLDIDQKQADAAENAAQIALDQVTATEHVAVQNALIHLDTVQVTQATRVAAAQAHADAVQVSVDTTKIGPAQIAVDMNANASKSVQALMAAQLKDAQGQGDKQVAAALQQLAQVQTDSQSAIDAAQASYDATNNAASQQIQSAQDTLSNITNYWNDVIADAQGNLAGIQGNANQAEAIANSAYTNESALASTQFAGSGLTINQYGVDLSNPASVGEAASWAIRSSGVATV